MNASKEEAVKALDKLTEMSDGMPSAQRQLMAAKLIAIEEFLDAARRKLPFEASYAKAAKKKQLN